MSLAEHPAEPIQPPLFPRVTGRAILLQVSEKYGIPIHDLTGPLRWRSIARARQEAMWRMRHETRLSYVQIARLAGRTDHTTALWGIRAHAKRMGQG